MHCVRKIGWPRRPNSYRRALKHHPNYVDALNNLGMTLFTQDQVVAAEDCFRRALRVDANHADSLINLGKTLSSQKRLAEAADCYRQVFAATPPIPALISIWPIR